MFFQSQAFLTEKKPDVVWLFLISKKARISESGFKKAKLAILVAGHFHMRKFIAGHKRFCDVTINYCDVTNTLILIGFTP